MSLEFRPSAALAAADAPTFVSMLLMGLAMALIALSGTLSAQSLEDSRLTVQGSGQVEVYINGHYLGKSAGASRLSIRARYLAVGDNVIALRAARGDQASAAVSAELSGTFGRLGTTTLWRAQAVADDLGWIQPGYDDSAWPTARETGALLPAGFPMGGPARSVWSASDSDARIALRAHVWLPAAQVRFPSGLGRATTGGADGEVVVVHTREELASALCGSFQGSQCTDTTPRIIEMQGTIDYTGTEGTLARPGCDYSQCPAPMVNERLVLINSNDTHCNGKPTFDVSYDAAGAKPLSVGSNKTLVGIGNDAVLRGKGLFIGRGASNVIVRNLTIERINQGIIFAGDAITIDNADRVWIDHNRFSRIGRQMIVSGYGPATNVTISWNDFDGTNEISHRCDGRHYWNLLLLGDGDRITLANNWIRHFSGRAPHAGAGGSHVSLLHIAGNYFDDGTWHALDIHAPARALAEGNVFRSVSVPILDSAGAGNVWADRESPTLAHQANCLQYLGRECVGNQLSEQPVGWTDHFRNDLVVLGDFSAQTPALSREAPEPVGMPVRMIPFLAGAGHLEDAQLHTGDAIFADGFED